jgi:hypothetical protein
MRHATSEWADIENQSVIFVTNLDGDYFPYTNKTLDNSVEQLYPPRICKLPITLSGPPHYLK